MTDDIKDLIAQGVELMAAERYEAAKALFERVLAQDPRNFEAQMHLGNACVNLGRFKEGIKAFRNAQMIQGDSPEATYSLGCAYFLDGQNVAALKQFNRCEKLGYASVDMYGLMEVIFLDAKDNTQAIRCANRAIRLEPLNPGPYIDKAQIFLLDGKTREAINCLEEVEELLPDAGDPYVLQARIYTQTGEYDQALGVVDRAEERFPEDAAVALEKLRVLNAMERYPEAVAQVARVRALAGDAAETLRDLCVQEGVALAGAQDVDGSIAALAALVDTDGGASDGEALFMLVNECFGTQRYEEAARYGAQLMGLEEVEPRFRAAGIFWNASALDELGRAEEARAAYREATRTLRRISIGNPGLIEVYAYRALCHKGLGEFDKAVALCDHMIEVAPGSPAGYSFKADVLAAKGDEAEAEALRAKVLELDPAYAL